MMKNKGRNGLIALLHIAKKDLGLDDDIYRDILEQQTGQRSAKDLTLKQLEQVLRYFASKGFKQTSNAVKKPQVKESKQALIGKIEAQLAEQKLSWEYAVGIAKNMFGKEALEFCTERQLWKIVAALEYHAKRQKR